MDLAGPSDDCSTVEQLVRAVVVLCCGASSVYNTDEDGHSNGVTSASIQAARSRVPRWRAPAEILGLEFFGVGDPKPCGGPLLSHAFIRHSPEDQSLLSLSWSVLIYAQICVLRALDGEIFFASGGAARRGAREGLLSMSAR